MSGVSDNNKKDSFQQVRMAFPQVCKWFHGDGGQPATELAVSEVEERFQRLRQNNISPCENCPLCPGHK